MPCLLSAIVKVSPSPPAASNTEVLGFTMANTLLNYTIAVLC